MTSRIVADGKALRLAGQPFRVRGVTYGSFLPRRDGHQFPEPERVHADFQQIAAMGLNTVRLYTAPTPDVLEAAAERGLRLIVGVDYRDWRYHTEVGLAADRSVLDAGRRALDEAIAACAGRPEVLAYSVGNEIPADVVRVHGIGAVEDILSTLVGHARASDPEALVTYTNFPTTEYLRVEGQTLATFNVFLEEREALRRYLRHLQVVTAQLPLVLTELGLPGSVRSEAQQAEGLRWQFDEVDSAGCAGATVFSFTDEWGVNGQAVTGWDFGITDEQRRPKAAAEVTRSWAERHLIDLRTDWPRVSVVVCAYNEERTIQECLASLAACDYPNLDVIMCDDGSTDRTLEIARTFPFRILELDHGGLSRARNAGIEAATGEIVAFLDADAACDPQWPWYLALGYDNDEVVAAGGPNWPFADAPLVERAVALSPGSPLEVLISDDRAEHVPGCNMSFRREAIRKVGCFDPIYTSAGDDVDVCWKLLDEGGQIAFVPAAQIHHHRRATVKGYLRQQRGYGRAEKLLLPAHRHRFNELGQARWSGFIYGGVELLPALLRPVIYHGYQGHAPFQRVASRPAEIALGWAGALLPYSTVAAAVGLLAGVLISPWWFLLAVAALLAVVGFGVAVATSLRLPSDEPEPERLRLLVGYLHVAQPFVRTWGRLRGPRRPLVMPVARPWWGDRAVWLRDLEQQLRSDGRSVRVGGPTDNWDLEVRTLLARLRVTTAVVWRWQPTWRISTVATRLLVLLVVSTLLAVWGAVAGSAWWLLVPVGLAGVGTAVLLRARSSLSKVVTRTVRGAVGGEAS